MKLSVLLVLSVFGSTVWAASVPSTSTEMKESKRSWAPASGLTIDLIYTNLTEVTGNSTFSLSEPAYGYNYSKQSSDTYTISEGGCAGMYIGYRAPKPALTWEAGFQTLQNVVNPKVSGTFYMLTATGNAVYSYDSSFAMFAGANVSTIAAPWMSPGTQVNPNVGGQLGLEYRVNQVHFVAGYDVFRVSLSRSGGDDFFSYDSKIVEQFGGFMSRIGYTF